MQILCMTTYYSNTQGFERGICSTLDSPKTILKILHLMIRVRYSRLNR